MVLEKQHHCCCSQPSTENQPLQPSAGFAQVRPGLRRIQISFFNPEHKKLKRLMRILLSLLIATAVAFIPLRSAAQDTAASGNTMQPLPASYFAAINKKIRAAEKQFDKQTARPLRKLQKQQSKILDNVRHLDSAAVKELRQSLTANPLSLKNICTVNYYPASGAGISYQPRMDSLQTMLRFLRQLSPGNAQAAQALQQLEQLQTKLQEAEHIKGQLSATLQKLKDLQNLPGLKSLQKQITKYQRQASAYAQTIHQYKALLNQPEAIERKALALLNQLPAFKNFMAQHGQLASFFGLPLTPSEGGGMASLQPRAVVQQLVQQSIGAGALQQVRDNVQAAQSELQKIKNKAAQLGNNKVEEDGGLFASAATAGKQNRNAERNKTFLQRIQLGGNIQFAKPNGFVPTTSDVAVTVAYKLNSKSSIGIGGSYKLGIGSWKRIRFTHEGVSLRSFADLKLKGQLFITGGYELNHGLLPASSDLSRLIRDGGGAATPSRIPYWQSSGLVGLSRKYKIGKKRGGNFQVLYDFLSNQHSPRTTPVLIRTGFNF
jgi:hypothetical protein